MVITDNASAGTMDLRQRKCSGEADIHSQIGFLSSMLICYYVYWKRRIIIDVA